MVVESWQGQAAGAISVVGKAVLTLYPPLRPLSHNVNPRDGAQDTLGTDGTATDSSSEEEQPASAKEEHGPSSDDSAKSVSVASVVAKWEQPPTAPLGSTFTPVSGRSLVSDLANEIQTLSTASMGMLTKIEKLEKQAALTTTSVREDVHYITKLNTKHTNELSLKSSTHLHLSDLRTTNQSRDWRSPGARLCSRLDSR